MKTKQERGVGRPRKDIGKTISYFGNIERDQRITLIAKAKKVSKSSIIETAIQQYLESDDIKVFFAKHYRSIYNLLT